MKLTSSKLCAALVAALLATSAQATLNIQVGDHLTVNGDINSSKATTGTITYQSSSGLKSENCWAGAFSVNVTDVTTPGSATIATFCTDVGVNWQYGNQNYTAKDFASAQGVGDPTWNGKPYAIQNAAWIYNKEFVAGGALSAVQAAGIQLAIWKVLYDTSSSTYQASDNFSTGNLRASGFGSDGTHTAIWWAGQYVDALNAARGGTSFDTYTTTWLSPDLKNSQGLIWTPQTPNGNVAVPEPSTMLAGALLLMPLCASSLRIIRRK